MAQLRKQVLGQLQGGIASVVIKYRNGKPYVASKPGKCNTGKDPVTLFKKNQGKFIGKLSSVIYKIEILKNSDGSPFINLLNFNCDICIKVSISHSKNNAIAMVMAEKINN